MQEAQLFHLLGRTQATSLCSWVFPLCEARKCLSRGQGKQPRGRSVPEHLGTRGPPASEAFRVLKQWSWQTHWLGQATSLRGLCSLTNSTRAGLSEVSPDCRSCDSEDSQLPWNWDRQAGTRDGLPPAPYPSSCTMPWIESMTLEDIVR